MLSYSSLYSEQQLTKIDTLIENNMDEYLESLVSNKISSLLQQEMTKYQYATTQFHSESYEENVCTLVNNLCERWMKKQEVYIDQVNQQKMQKQEKILSISQKQHAILQQKETINRISTQIIKQNKQKHELNTKRFKLLQEFNSFKQNCMQQLSTKQTIIQHQQIKLNQLQQQLKEKFMENEQLTAQILRLKQKQQLFKSQIEQLQEFLSEDREKYKLGLITSNILANELNQSYDEKIKELNKYAKIHQENKSIVHLLGRINNQSKVNFTQIEKCQLFSNSLSLYQASFFDLFGENIKVIAQKLQKYSQNYKQIIKSNEIKAEIIAQRQLYISQLEQKQKIMNQNLQKYQTQNQLLKQITNKHTNQHYNTLIEVEKNKRKIQDSLLQNLDSLKKLQEKYMILQQQSRQKQHQISQLSSKLSQLQQLKQSLQQQCKQKQKINFQLKQQILNIKSNLDIMMKTEQDDQDSNFNIVQQLIDKNNELTNQMTLKKMQMDLKQQKITYQQKIIDQYVQQIEHLTHQVERINDDYKQLEMELEIQRKESQLSHEKIQQLFLQIQQFKNKETLKALITYNQIDIQTDQIHHTIQSRIKKQKINHPPKTQVQKSHSLLSQQNESKQNTLNNNNNKATVMNTRQKDTYKEKIVTLNQIINYMLNYAKGYQYGEIRCGSWFISQIQKYGTQYELKILDPIHLQSKIKNIKFIQKSCKQDSTCNRLIKEFQTVMQFYLTRNTKLSTSSLSITPITQQKLNKTVNKSKNPSNKYNF